jgi:hypothetical protein
VNFGAVPVRLTCARAQPFDSLGGRRHFLQIRSALARPFVNRLFTFWQRRGGHGGVSVGRTHDDWLMVDLRVGARELAPISCASRLLP